MIYIAEAHADDVWPLGYGINQSNNLEERWKNCDNFMEQWPELVDMVDNIFIDNMKNEFILETGAWPEGYFITDKDGIVQWKRTVVKNESCADFVQEAQDYLKLNRF